jgi:hypothetical protein
MDKAELLKQIWETCTFDEIIDAGFEYNKCSGEQLINAAAEFEAPEINEKDFIERLTKLCEDTPKANLPWGHDVMSVLTDYFYDTGLLDYFDNDSLIDYLEGSWEMDEYIKDKTNEISEEYEDRIYTFKDYTREVEELPNWKMKRYLCDLFSCSYFVTDEELAKKIIEKIK